MMMIILFGFILKLIIIDTILEELKYFGIEVPNILIWKVDVEYATKVLSMLLKAGINVNQVDKYGAIPLIAAITVLKLTTKEVLPLYEMLIASGSNIHRKDFQGKSAIDYAREFSWRQDLLSENGGLLADE